MAGNRTRDDDFDDDMDALGDEIEIEPFLDAMALQDGTRGKKRSPRRAIEALMEKQRLKKLLEDYPEFD